MAEQKQDDSFLDNVFSSISDTVQQVGEGVSDIVKTVVEPGEHSDSNREDSERYMAMREIFPGAEDDYIPEQLHDEAPSQNEDRDFEPSQGHSRSR